MSFQNFLRFIRLTNMVPSNFWVFEFTEFCEFTSFSSFASFSIIFYHTSDTSSLSILSWTLNQFRVKLQLNAASIEKKIMLKLWGDPRSSWGSPNFIRPIFLLQDTRAHFWSAKEHIPLLRVKTFSKSKWALFDN